jgi:uncharacterized protein involved in exopolysaccharide biosynthesis
MDSRRTKQSLDRMLGAVERRAVWILLCVVLATGAVYLISRVQPRKYTATASLQFNENQLAQFVGGLPVTSSSSQQAQRRTTSS